MRTITSSSLITACLALAAAAGALPTPAHSAAAEVPATPAHVASGSLAAVPSTPTLVAIRAAHHATYDRVVFEFQGAVPTHRTVRYVDKLIADGSGIDVPVAGRTILEVSLFPAQAHTDSGQVSAPSKVTYDLPNVVQVVRSGDFEAVTTHGIGLASRQPVKVSTLTNPSRVILDIRADFTTVRRNVWMLNQTNFIKGQAPYFTPVGRTLPQAAPAGAALDRIFAGPTATERQAGLRTVLSGATGFRNLSIASGIARVQLTGGCSSGGSTVSIADQIRPTLKQFSTVNWVKIYDPAGRTARPTGSSDSIPECLEP